MADPKLNSQLLNLTVREVASMVREGIKINWLLNPYVDGIEVTQSIQYYNAEQHLTDPSDRGANNSVRLVAFKPAWVRVYLRTLLYFEVPNISGELVISRRSGPFNALWQTVATISPLPPGTANAHNFINYAAERGTIGSTLNFIIPAAEMFGYLRLTVNIWRQGENETISTYSEDVDVTLLQTLRLRGIFISYNGPNAAGTGTLNLASPTLADLQNTAAYTLTVDPVQSTGSFASAGTLAWSTPLTGVATSPGGCSTQWFQLNAAVAQVKTNDGNRNDVIYYGLLPNGVPIANVGGCESSGVSTGPNGAQVTMAHEVGHGAGLGHGPCGTSSGDASYPAYEPYETTINKMSSIGEYGLNINTGAILSPANNDDYMSYCNQNWISLYHHAKLINVARFNPQTVGINHWRPPLYIDPWLWPWEIRKPGPVEVDSWNQRFKMAQPLISIIGIMGEEGKVNVQSVMHILALPEIENTRETPFIAKVLNADQKVISQGPLMRFISHGCRCGNKNGNCRCVDQEHEARGPFVFQALLPDVDEGTMLTITHGKPDAEPQQVWSRQAPSRKPNVVSFEVYPRDTVAYAHWEVEDVYSDSLDFSIQFSKDEGRSWNGVAVGLKEREFQIDLLSLPSGDVIFALLAHDGFHTTKRLSTTVTLPKQPSVVSILHPREGAVFIEGQHLRLWGAVTSYTASPIDQRKCRWIIDDHEVQIGIDGWISAPTEGEHRCTFYVEDNDRFVESTVWFVTERN